MATAPVKSPLHNFPVSLLKWGSTSSVNPHHRCRRPADSPPPDSDPSPAEDHAPKQWNLRPRKPAPAPSEIGAGLVHAKAAESEAPPPKSSRLRGDSERKEKQKLWVSLSKEEIEEDFFALTGAKPSRRPRKRPRALQKQLDTLSPGMWLVGVSPETYRCLDAPSKK